MDFRSQFLITNSSDKLNLSTTSTAMDLGMEEKEILKVLKKNRKELAELQEKIYAEHSRGVLIVFQAMDAAGRTRLLERCLLG